MVGIGHLGAETGLLPFFQAKGACIFQVWTTGSSSVKEERLLSCIQPGLWHNFSAETPLSLQPWAYYFLTNKIPGINSIEHSDLVSLPLSQDYNPFSAGNIFDLDLDTFTPPLDIGNLPTGFNYLISRNNSTYRITFLQPYLPLSQDERGNSWILTSPLSKEEYKGTVCFFSVKGTWVPRLPLVEFVLTPIF